ncbi:hypothetical protein S83_011917 [Arachis hypogaea]
MVSGNDPVESFFNSIQVVKESLFPLEVGIRKAVKDLEHCFLSGHKNKDTKGVCLIAQVKQGGEFHICNVKKKRGLSMKVPLKIFLGIFSQNLVSGNGNVNGNGDEMDKKGDGSSSCTNCLKFAVTRSLLVNIFLQALLAPFKDGKEGGDKVGVSEEVEGKGEAEPAVEIGEEEMEGGKRVVIAVVVMIRAKVIVVIGEKSGGRI